LHRPDDVLRQIAWHSRSGTPDHDIAAATLVRRLNKELEHRYRFVYDP